MDSIVAPWTEDQVRELNRYQQAGFMHPFTCGGDECREVLVATENGWKCPNCDYTQNWAHPFMASKESNDQGENMYKNIFSENQDD